jgi:DNA-binding response OmpR family regulator
VSVLRTLRSIDPRAPIVVISGSTPAPDEAVLFNDAATHFLPKPFKPSEVLSALHALRSARGIRNLFEPKA